MMKTASILASVFVLGLVACSDGHKTAGGVSAEENTIADGDELPGSTQPLSSSSVQQDCVGRVHELRNDCCYAGAGGSRC